jgi:hypothetical protein
MGYLDLDLATQSLYPSTCVNYKHSFTLSWLVVELHQRLYTSVVVSHVQVGGGGIEVVTP